MTRTRPRLSYDAFMKSHGFASIPNYYDVCILTKVGDGWVVRATACWGVRRTTRTIGRGRTALRALRKAGMR